MKKICLFLALCLLLTSCHTEKTQVYFSPSLDCETQIISNIDSVQDTLEIALYSFTNENIAQAVYRAHKRDVKIRILADKSQAAQKYSFVRALYQNGVNIRVVTHYKIFHDKLAIFDGQKIIAGSYNWTESASHNNHEYCILIQDEPNLIKKLINEFNFQWEFNTQKRSDQWFQKKKRKKPNLD